MLRRLATFYESHGISPVDFRCPSRSECAAGSPDFTEAKMSSVPPRYGLPGLPRLLFQSLDSGSGSSDPRERTAEAVRQWNVECDVAALPKNNHWYRTHELAFELLRQFKQDLTVPETRLYFAHVNSAKCCQNKSGRKRADSILFENCRRFIPGELGLLSPDVVVTQGGPAKTAIVRSFSVRRHDVRAVDSGSYAYDAHYETGVIELGPGRKRCLWIQTYHPNNYGRFQPQRRYCWPLYAEAVARFWGSRAKNSTGSLPGGDRSPLHTGATCHERDKESLRGSP